MLQDIESLHLAACDAGEDFYTDPESGLLVFTALSHRNRGKCCGNEPTSDCSN